MNKVSVGICEMSVNDARLDYGQDSKRRAKPCKACQQPTKGRASIFSPTRNFANLPYCMSCAIGEVTRLGLGAAPKAMKQLGGTQ